MKYFIFLLILFAVSFNSCNDKFSNDPGVSITGKWLVTAYYADPRDGSGTYQPVSQSLQQFISFQANGGLQSNYMTFDLMTIRSYTFIDSARVKFTSADQREITYRYKIEGNRLTLNPPCIEGCGIRLIKSE